MAACSWGEENRSATLAPRISRGRFLLVFFTAFVDMFEFLKTRDNVRRFFSCYLPRSVLLVKLISAQDLPPKDDEELLDVFVKTQLVPSRKRVFISKVHRESSNPVFNESYEFDIEYQELQQQKLLFQILDYDCMSRYKPVGEVSVLLAELGTHGFNILREVSLCVYISRPRRESTDSVY